MAVLTSTQVHFIRLLFLAHFPYNLYKDASSLCGNTIWTTWRSKKIHRRESQTVRALSALVGLKYPDEPHPGPVSTPSAQELLYTQGPAPVMDYIVWPSQIFIDTPKHKFWTCCYVPFFFLSQWKPSRGGIISHPWCEQMIKGRKCVPDKQKPLRAPCLVMRFLWNWEVVGWGLTLLSHCLN